MTDIQSYGQSTNNDVDYFTLLLRGTRPIRVGKLCFPQTDLLIMRLVVQLQSLICIRKILHCLILDLVINRNPIE